MVKLWELRLSGEHCFNPILKAKVELPSDKEELNERIEGVFLEKLNRLINGVLVQKWQKKLGFVIDEIGKISLLLKKPNRIGVYQELCKKKKGIEGERDLILSRIDEYKNGIKCIIDNLEDSKNYEDVKVFDFGEGIDWNRIHFIMMRECRRLDDGLPIYGFRQQILQQILSHQVKFNITYQFNLIFCLLMIASFTIDVEIIKFYFRYQVP